MTASSRISTILTAYRKHTKHGMRELAAQIDILPSTLNRLEKGQRAGDAETQLKIINWIFGEK